MQQHATLTTHIHDIHSCMNKPTAHDDFEVLRSQFICEKERFVIYSGSYVLVNQYLSNTISNNDKQISTLNQCYLHCKVNW